MALLPAIAGVAIGGAGVDTLWLLAAWMLCYCMQFTVARWLKSRCARRYLPPAITYTAALTVVGLPFVIIYPGIARWAPIYAVFAAMSFSAAWLRRERSLWSNAAAVAAASLMATVIASFGMRIIPGCDGGTATGAENPAWCEQTVPLYYEAIRSLPDAVDMASGNEWWPAYSLPSTGLVATVIFALAQSGSVLFVKTMIRERGKRSYLLASWGWHAALVVLAALTALQMAPAWWLLALVAAVLLIRAVVMPLVARRRRLKPIAAGLVEMGTSLLVFAVVLFLLVV